METLYTVKAKVSPCPDKAPDPVRKPQRVTELLQAWRRGDSVARDELVTFVYEILHRMAVAQLQRERRNHTLQPTALVHEVYVRLVDQRRIDFRDRGQFYGLATQLMRRILVDYARQRGAAKRYGGGKQVPLDDVARAVAARSQEMLAVDHALRALAAVDGRKAMVVEFRYFGGFSLEETAEFMGVSEATVKRDWAFAKAWLRREMRRADPTAHVAA